MAAPSSRKVLLVDPDSALLEKLGRRLRRAQLEVQTASDGARALESALKEKPDLVITNYHLPLFDGERLRAFLRSNPTTSHIPFIYLVDAAREKDITLASIGPDARLVKPFRWEDLSGHIDRVLSPTERGESSLRAAGSGVEGSLGEVSLVDLLQIFSLNRRTGVLTLKDGDRQARIFVRDGEILNCVVGEVSGEKALYRILRWKGGGFSYRPEPFEVPRNISRATDALLMEGMRQLDEWHTLRASLPPDDTVLALVKSASELPRDLRPVTQEVILLLEFYSRLGDIIEKSTHPDYDVCKTLLGLLQKGIVAESGTPASPPDRPAPLLEPEQALELSRILKVGEADPNGPTPSKILVFAASPELVKAFLAGTGEMEEFRLSRDNFSNQEILNLSFGSLGSLTVGEKLRFRLFLLPSGAEAQPLWRPFSDGAVGAILLGGGEEGGGPSSLSEVAAFVERELDQPFVVEEAGGGPSTKAAALHSFARFFEALIAHSRRQEALRQ